MAFGLLLAAFAGAMVALQTIFNNRTDIHMGSWATTTWVLGMGFLASLACSLIFEGGRTFQLQHMQPWYWFSGMIGVGVVICLVLGVKILGPTFSVSVTLTAQLGFALLFDSMGWLGLEKVDFDWKQIAGVAVLIGGIYVFKFGGKKKTEASERSASPLGDTP
ncbi:DMT family transporter [Saccharibacillus alkalitolerans]|uniref:DMT family transporter n=1 Tax=Saccharibacillus alkalitolerans TaxID=2705290 RepID=A0ABX0F2N4_9BACL|nr:DMT family transporter [Saccharibacillus alkalitolerans]NGZ74735.1 DMT family transporter [Saccharibacillus alkalitolerans]